MTRSKLLFAVLFVAALFVLVAGAPAAQAQAESCGTGCAAHFIGAGSSAQFITAGLAADQAAINACNAYGSVAGSLFGACFAPNFAATANYTINHWSKKYAAGPPAQGAQLLDNRDTRIYPETGNLWVVWIENCTSGTCTTSDVWTDVSVDSTVGVRCFSAVQSATQQGCFLQLLSTTAGTGSDQAVSKAPQNLWPDGQVDTTLGCAANAAGCTVAGDSSIITALNFNNFSLEVNVGLTDIRPEDALYATKRAYGTLNTSTYADLGYVDVANKIGSQINTDQGVLQGTGSTGTFAQPVSFGLAGQADPFNTHLTVSSYTTFPLGAAPIVFVANNGGLSGFPRNLVTGVTPDLHATGQTYPLAHLFDGTQSCDTDHFAFGGNGDGKGNAVTLFLREPLSGTMNTTEFSLFRSYDNTDDSQEKGVTSPNGGSPYNPLQLQCSASTAAGTGYRSRGIGTGEIVGKSGAYGLLGPLGTAKASLGYIFTGWGNLGKFGGSANYNYLTLDGVDPLFSSPTSTTYGTCFNASNTPEYSGQICALNGNVNEQCSGTYVCTAGGNVAQTVPLCNTATCSSDFWGSEGSYPNVRNGQYLAWSMYRWISSGSNTDPYGPALVSQEAQNYVSGSDADFVPLSACAPGTGSTCLSTSPTDGLSVFRSHFTPSGVTTGCSSLSNGSVTTAAANGANTLGGGTECGGDVGGLIYGPWGINSPQVSWVTWTTTHTANKGYKLTHKSGDAFTSSQPANGSSVTLTCTDSTGVQNIVNTTVVNSSGTIYAAVTNPDTTTGIACKLVGPSITHNAATSTQDGSSYHSKHQ